MTGKRSTDTAGTAREFMELWQEQLHSMMTNPDISGDFFSGLYKMQQDIINKSTGDDNAADTADDIGLSQHGNDELSELKHRLDACETRIAALEAGTGNQSGKSVKGN